KTSIAGSTLTAWNSVAKLPSAFARRVAFWLSISCTLLTCALEVANQSCQMNVMRSTSGWLVRTMRSSHQQWSSPHVPAGSSGPPLELVGDGPLRTSAPLGRVRLWTTSASGWAASACACPGLWPKPARHRSLWTCAIVAGPATLWTGALDGGGGAGVIFGVCEPWARCLPWCFLWALGWGLG